MQVEPFVTKFVGPTMGGSYLPAQKVVPSSSGVAKERTIVKTEVVVEEEEAPVVLFLGEDSDVKDEPDLSGDQLTSQT